MDDYISRQTAMDCLTGIFEYPVSLHDYITATLKKLQNAPSADVQTVVRCKDCKYYEWTSNRVPEQQTWFCYNWDAETGNNDFCSYGVRRGGEQSG